MTADATALARRARATLVARFGVVPDEERAAIAERAIARAPEMERLLAMRDFAFFRGEIVRVRFIAGFGEICWIEPEAWGASRQLP